MKIAIINGVNLNLLGTREVEIYGKMTFEDYFSELKKKYSNIELFYFQSNIEGEIVNQLHYYGFDFQGIILNAGAYTHTSVALYDAIKSIKTPVIEVHISNTFAREDFRHKSYISPVAKGIILGLGLKGYDLAIDFLINQSV